MALAHGVAGCLLPAAHLHSLLVKLACASPLLTMLEPVKSPVVTVAWVLLLLTLAAGLACKVHTPPSACKSKRCACMVGCSQSPLSVSKRIPAGCMAAWLWLSAHAARCVGVKSGREDALPVLTMLTKSVGDRMPPIPGLLS